MNVGMPVLEELQLQVARLVPPATPKDRDIAFRWSAKGSGVHGEPGSQFASQRGPQVVRIINHRIFLY